MPNRHEKSRKAMGAEQAPLGGCRKAQDTEQVSDLAEIHITGNVVPVESEAPSQASFKGLGSGDLVLSKGFKLWL